MTNLAHSPTNDTRLSDFMSAVREFGRNAAEGKDALPALAISVARAAYDGVITLDKDKNGQDDFSRLYDEYTKAESKKAVHTHTAGGIKANVSKIRAIGKAAIHTRENGGDFVQTLDDAMTMHREMAKADSKSVQPPYAACVSVARKQLDEKDDLSREAIRDAIAKAAPADPTVEKALERVVKSLENLITGEKGVKCQDERVCTAHDLVKETLAALVLDRETAELDVRLAERGLKVVPVTLTGNQSDTFGDGSPAIEQAQAA